MHHSNEANIKDKNLRKISNENQNLSKQNEGTLIFKNDFNNKIIFQF
jgi:hypothetical protein